jgi:hypothetical protein
VPNVLARVKKVDPRGRSPSMALPLLVTHERLGTWARQLRSRLAAPATGIGSIRWVESRTGSDLDRVVRGAAAPVVLIDVADRPRAMLEDLDLAAQAAPSGFFLVLDPKGHPGVAGLARELGATLVLSGFVPPPRVADLLIRWVPIARRRAEADGWAVPHAPDPEPWESRELFDPSLKHSARPAAIDRP